MSRLLLRLNGVPEDEAEEIRALLTASEIDFYETDAGRWGFSVAALWLRSDEQLDTARALIDGYQSERETRMRAEYETLRREGRHETLWARLASDPLRFLFYAFAILAVLYLSLIPFLRSWG